jgi:hypothetical protein
MPHINRQRPNEENREPKSSRTSNRQPDPQRNGDGRGYQLHKNHAVVHTASIDVKIIRLDKRQLTLSVFRQLDEEPIFLSNGSLVGTPWGRVNYTWKGNPRGTAFHVVWQHGDYLKRSPVPYTDRIIRNLLSRELPEWLWDRYCREVRELNYGSDTSLWSPGFTSKSPKEQNAARKRVAVEKLFWQRVEEMYRLDQLFIAT